MRLWAVPGRDAAQLTSLVGRGPVYIADGHHRYETASSYATENSKVNRLLAFVVSARDDGLAVLPTHRVIYGAPVDPALLAEAWRETFDVAGTRTAVSPETPGTWSVVWPGGKSQALTLRTTVARGMSELDVISVGDLVVRSIVQRAGTAQIIYQPDARAAAEAGANGGATAAILMPAAQVQTVISVADANGIMPPKSTYFVPKVPAGLVLADWR